MLRFLLCGVLCATAIAQEPADLFTKAPPEVDAALRARITQFYQFHVESKFRQAEALVAEDTKDFFYSANKPRYLSFEISRIDYLDEFRKARGLVIVETIVPVMGFADRPLKVPISSLWKLENGDWYWYVDQEALSKTPWGTMKASPSGIKRPPSGAVPPPPIPDPRRLMANIAAQVTADKSALRLTPGSSGEVTIRNGLPGAIALAIEGGPAKGLAARLDRAELKTGEKAVVTVSADGGMPASQAPHVVAVRAQPTNQLFEIQVTVAAK